MMKPFTNSLKRFVATFAFLLLCGTVSYGQTLYNAHDVARLKVFLSQDNSLYRKNWELISLQYGNPAAWTEDSANWATLAGVVWTDTANDKRIEEIKWEIYWLEGTLDLSGCAALEKLVCKSTALTAMDLSGCILLEELDCSNNRLASLNLSGCAALKELECSQNEFTELDVSMCTLLTLLNCYGNRLTELDITPCVALATLECGVNRLSHLDLSQSKSLTTLKVYNNRLAQLDLSPCKALVSLTCSNNSLAELDVSPCALLESLHCDATSLTELDVTKCTALKQLDCSRNSLSRLDVSMCKGLEELDCSFNSLTGLDVSACKALTSLRCYYNSMTLSALPGQSAQYITYAYASQTIREATPLPGPGITLNTIGHASNTAYEVVDGNDVPIPGASLSGTTVPVLTLPGGYNGMVSVKVHSSKFEDQYHYYDYYILVPPLIYTFRALPEKYAAVHTDLVITDGPDIRDHFYLSLPDGEEFVEKDKPFELLLSLNQHTEQSDIVVEIDGQPVDPVSTEQAVTSDRPMWTSELTYTYRIVPSGDLTIRIDGIRWNNGHPFWTDASNRNTSWDPSSRTIRTAEDLAQLAWLVNKEGRAFRDTVLTLAADIDLAGRYWEPIGNTPNEYSISSSFQGTFEGNGKIIRGLMINKNLCNFDISSFTGFFGVLSGPAIIQNLTLEAPQITGINRTEEYSRTITGALAGALSEKASINNCHITAGDGSGFVESGDASFSIITGGLVGQVNALSSIGIHRCSNGVTVIGGRFGSTGGLIGQTFGNVSSCYNRGAVKAKYNNARTSLAGLIGSGGGTVTNCYNTGRVSGANGRGGPIGGLVVGASQAVVNCYNSGALSGDGAIGGLVTSANVISGCLVVTPKITASQLMHRIACYESGSYTNNYAWADMAGGTWVSDASGLDGADWSGLMTDAPILLNGSGGWDPAVWDIDPTHKRMPKLIGLPGQPDIPNPAYKENTTGIDSPARNVAAKVYALPGRIVIEDSRFQIGDQEPSIHIYNVMGRLVYASPQRSDKVSVPVEKGIYIVAIGNHRQKVVVR